MSFLECHVDLSGTIYSDQDLKIAKRFLKEFLGQHVPTWLANPIGPISTHWKSDGAYSACYIIRLAQIFDFLGRNITKKSIPVFNKKINELFGANEKQFEELLTEFDIAVSLAGNISPIAFEPLVPIDCGDGDKPRSPDFGVLLPECGYVIEVTVFHVDIIDEWYKMIDHVYDKINKLLTKANVSKKFSLNIPLGVTLKNITQVHIKKIDKRLVNSDSGKEEIALGAYSIKLVWEPPQLDKKGEHSAELKDIIKHFTCIDYAPILPDDFDEVILKSLRNTINGKRDQWEHPGPYLVGIKLGNPRITTERLQKLIELRIFPNKIYSKISGILIYKPLTSFNNGDSSNLVLVPNSNSIYPIGKQFYSVFSENAKFHLP